MKNLTLLFVCTVLPFWGFGQSSMMMVYASAGSGSYVTGSATYAPSTGTYGRSDDLIMVTSPVSPLQVNRGYAVFNLSAVPAGATITQVALGFFVSGYTAGVFGQCNTYGYTGNLSGVTTPATLYGDCAAGTLLWSSSATSISSNGSYGSSVGHDTMFTSGATGAACTFIASNARGVVSISFTGGGTNAYNIVGETGSYTLTGAHLPYLAITYTIPPCSGTPAGGTAIAGAISCYNCPLTLSLTGATSAPGIVYQWQSSPNSTTWTNIPGATTAPYIFSPSADAYYRCKVTCTYGGASAYSTAVYVPIPTFIIADSVYDPLVDCRIPNFFVITNQVSPLLKLVTFFGDGSNDSATFVAGTISSYVVDSHVYVYPGNYQVKHVLYDSGVIRDFTVINYQNEYCQDFRMKLFWDMNGDCIKDISENINNLPVTFRIDSMGIPVDTISATSGFTYHAKGSPGTIYSFSLLAGSMYTLCAPGGIVYDTVLPGFLIYPPKFCGLLCPSGPPDVAVKMVLTEVWPTDETGHIYVYNNTCSATSSAVIFHYSTKYGGSAMPSTPIPGEINMTLPSMTVMSGIYDIYFKVKAILGLYPLVGDTVHDHIIVTSSAGDMDITNNEIIKTDTVKSGWDPNFTTVSPASCFDAADTEFEYTIHFENTGNDTAHNIFILDTLDGNLNLGSLRIVLASAEMETYISKENGLNVIKFDFPHINLLDSSHHGLCDGVVIFKIQPKNALADGTIIPHHAGIYFDINPVVMTNVVYDIKGCPVTYIPNISAGKAEIYPNPTTDELTIKMDKDAYSSCVITNSIGQVLMQQPLNGTQTKVNVKTLPAGLYYITVKGNIGSTVRKFVKL